MIEKFAAQFGIKTISPEEDLSSDAKRDYIKKLDLKDNHQKDAAASAFFAYSQIKPLIDKIKNYAEKNNKQKIFEKIVELVVKNEINIAMAVDLIEMPDAETSAAVKKAIEKKEFSKEFNIVYERMKIAEAENKQLKEYLENLENQIEQKEKIIAGLESRLIKPVEKKIKEKLDFKEQKIISYSSKIKEKKDEVNYLKNKIKELNNFISNAEGKILVKKIDNLAWNEFTAKSFLKIKEGDFVLVNDVSNVSEKTLSNLKGCTLILRKPKELSGFVSLNASDLDLFETDNYAFAERKQIEKAIAKKNILKKVVEEYKEKRK